MIAASKVKSPPKKMHELYVWGRSRRNDALKKVINQWQVLQQAEKLFDTLEEFGGYGEEYVSPELHFLAHWILDEEEGNLDQTIHDLVVVDTRVAEAAEADRVACEKYPAEATEYGRMRAGGALMNQRGLRARFAAPLAAKAPARRFAAPPDSAKAPAGKYNYGQVRDIVRNAAMNRSLGKESARDVLIQDGGGVTNVSSMLPENLDNVYEACQVMLSGEGASSEGNAENMIPIGPHEAVDKTSAKARGLLAKHTVQS